MELYYNDVALHLLGTVSIGGLAMEPFPADSPQRQRVRLRVRLDTNQDSYYANRQQILAALAALRTQHAILRWVEGAVEHLNRTAIVAEHNLPDDPNAWGTYHQQLEITFLYEEDLVANALALTFQKPAGAIQNLGQVHTWRRRYAANRYSELRSVRSGAQGAVMASGLIPAITTRSLAQRRQDLKHQATALFAALNGASGRMVYSPFLDKTVRIEEFSADVNQAADGILWSLSATFSEFPNEAGYALVEYETRTRQSRETGQYQTILSGRIGAQSEVAATAKLATLRAALSASVTGGRTLRLVDSETRVNQVEADTDGLAFLELHFTETYDGRLDGGDVAVRYAIRVRDDFVQRLRHTQVSGHVSAHRRVDADAALAQVFAALSITGNKLHADRSEDHGRYFGIVNNASDDIADYLVRLSFADTYEAAMTPADLVLEAELSEDIQFSGPRLVAQPTAFGADVIQQCGIESGRRIVSGRVRAASEAAAVAWCQRQYHLPKASGMPDLPATRYRRPPRLSLYASFPALVDGVARSTAANDPFNPENVPVQVPTWQGTFAYEELLPNYSWPA